MYLHVQQLDFEEELSRLDEDIQSSGDSEHDEPPEDSESAPTIEDQKRRRNSTENENELSIRISRK